MLSGCKGENIDVDQAADIFNPKYASSSIFIYFYFFFSLEAKKIQVSEFSIFFSTSPDMEDI